MDTATAQTLVAVAASVGLVVWLAAVRSLALASWSLRATASGASAERFEVDAPPAVAPGTVAGSVELAGSAEDLTEKLVAQLARDGLGPMAPVKILDRDARSVRFASAGPGAVEFRSGLVRFEPSSGSPTRARAVFAIEPTDRAANLVRAGWGIALLGLVVLIALPTVLWTTVVASPNPAVRYQAVQVVQIIHPLWPPFLLASLARRAVRSPRERVDAVLHNLPHS